MKLHPNEIIKGEVGTWIGTLIWIDWENNLGRAVLDQPPGTDTGGEPKEIECTFRYAGQHWVWNMNAYPAEDIASHSAYAFCVGDRVVLLHPVPPKMIPDPNDPWHKIPDPNSPKYAAVAVLKEEDDGSGGKITTLEKRKVWPLYRIGHEAFVLNFKYSGLGDKGAAFPFISDDGRRDLINPFFDLADNTRAFGTPVQAGGTGNPRLVVTREVLYDWIYGDIALFIPHAIHEFSEPGEDIPYVPDVLMQTIPNFRGRIMGWSAEDEILIDNIPVARVESATDLEATIIPSWKAVTKKFLYIDEPHNILTVLFVTMDCNYDWRPWEKSGNSNGENKPNDENNPNDEKPTYWYPPLYAFYVQTGSTELSSLCIYAAMETPREELPRITLVENRAASWLWNDLRRQEPNYILNNQADNLSAGVEIVLPGQEKEVYFWGGVVMTGMSDPGKRRKIGLVIKSSDDGSIRVEKRIGELELFSPFTSENLDAYVRHANRVYVNTEGEEVAERYIAEDYARLKRPVSEEVSRHGNASMVVEISGVDSYKVNETTYMATYDTDLRKRYLHKGPPGDFVIAEEKQILKGDQDILHQQSEQDTVRATISMIVFTHIDLLHGVYGYWNVTWLDDVPCKDVAPYNTHGGNYTGKNVIWEHFITSAKGTITTHIAEAPIPHGSDDDDNSIITNLAPLARLIRYSVLNNPGTPGFEPWGAHYCHNVWNLPRFKIDDMELSPEMRIIDIYNDRQHRYKWYMHFPQYYSSAIENDIYSWLQGTTEIHGTMRRKIGARRSPLYEFGMAPINKNLGIWPYPKNVCLGYGGDFLEVIDSVDIDRNFASVLYTDAMEFEGMATGSGDFVYTVSFGPRSGNTPTPSRVSSPGMEYLPFCTGRTDATITMD